MTSGARKLYAATAVYRQAIKVHPGDVDQRTYLELIREGLLFNSQCVDRALIPRASLHAVKGGKAGLGIDPTQR